jgi:phosphatidylglycerophosphatase A
LTERAPKATVIPVGKQIVQALATGFYLGKIPFAPGTWGTLLGIPVVWIMSRGHSDVRYMILVVVLILVASFIAELHERNTGGHDPAEIVIDEVAGYAVAMTMLPETWQSYVAAFVVFRIFDILKPFPINRIDERVKGGLGTVLDDVAAGLVTNVILQVVFMQTAWLGIKLNAS